MYSTDGGNTWSEYSGPVVVGAGKLVSLKSVSSHGDLKSRVVVIDEECSDSGDNVDTSTENPGSFFCRSNKQNDVRIHFTNVSRELNSVLSLVYLVANK